MPAIFGAAAEDVADLAIEAQGRDPEVTRRLALLLVRNLLGPDPQRTADRPQRPVQGRRQARVLGDGGGRTRT